MLALFEYSCQDNKTFLLNNKTNFNQSSSYQMSTEKPTSRLRFQSNIDSHSKNKLINSLINQKLTEEKEQVITRYVKLAKKASDEKPPEQQSQFQIRKRANSLKSLNVSMEKIKQSLMFNSVNANKQLSQESQFVISRQYKSPIISEEQVAELNGMRQKSGLFEVKLSSKDKTGLEYVNLQTPQKSQAWVREVQGSVDNQLWLSGLPHIQMLLEDLEESGKELKINQPNFDELPIVKSPVFNQHGNSFKPVISSLGTNKKPEPTLLINKNTQSSTKLIPALQVQRQQIVYDFKKYHKDDYLALQKWFQKNILLAHKRYSSKLKQDQHDLSSQKLPKQLLNVLYTIHIAGMQQIIRLNYVETWQKALVLEKVFWSLVRLFSTVVEQQHKLNYTQYKTYQKQIKQQRHMYEQRCSKLQIMMIRAQTEAKSSQTLRHRLSLAYVTYSRVNSHLYQELEFTAQRLSDLQNSFNFVNMKFMRLIDLLGEENRIKTIVTEFDTVYYLKVGQNDKLEELLRVKTSIEERKKLAKKTAQQQLKLQMEKVGKPLSNPKHKDEFQKAIIKQRQQIQSNFSAQPQQVFSTRIGQRIANVQHELNKYWVNKEQSLKVKEITHEELLNYTTVDIGTSTIQKFESADYSCQFPQETQKSFAEFLKEEIEKERKQHSKKIQKQEDLYVSLKELYEQSYEKVKFLETKKNQLTLELDNTMKILEKRQEKIATLQSELSLKNSDALVKSQTIESLLKEKRQLEKFISEHAQSSQQLQRKFSIEIQNSQALVRNNFKMKQQMQTLTAKLAQLEADLQQNQTKKGQIQVQLHHTQSNLNDYKQKYQQLHKNLLKISPSVDSFLEFKRYDRQSIIIASVKKDLEKYLPEYFCKDSDVFLTKG